MACSKYNLTNTGSTIVTFNYQRCDDTLWEYQVELDPGQTKNIWVVDGTYFTAPLYSQQVVLVNEGVFPPAITPTPSHTPTVTPTTSVTPTVTPTSSLTPTPTITPTSATCVPESLPAPGVSKVIGGLTFSANSLSFGYQSSIPAQTICGVPNSTTSLALSGAGVYQCSISQPTSSLTLYVTNLGSGETLSVFVNSATTLTQITSCGTNINNNPPYYATINSTQDGARAEIILSSSVDFNSITFEAGLDSPVYIDVCTSSSFPTPTPTTTQTPTVTPTASVTPTISVTPTLTQTPTPTNVPRTTLGGICHSETSSLDACNCVGTATIFVNGTDLSDSTLAWTDAVGPNTGDPTGYYVQNGIIYYLNGGCGIGCVSGATITVSGACAPTPTPTNTQTVTPTATPTITPTITPTNARFSFTVYTGVDSADACNQISSTVTIWGDSSLFDQNTQFYDSAQGPVTSDMAGFYNYNHIVTELDSAGAQQGAFSLCPTLTPTPTVTPTNTPTASVTPTVTPTPTQTIGYFTYSLGFSGTSAADACANSIYPGNYYAPLAGGPGPNVGEILYLDSTLSTPALDGYYSNGVAWYQITGGAGEITAVDPNGC